MFNRNKSLSKLLRKSNIREQISFNFFLIASALKNIFQSALLRTVPVPIKEHEVSK